MSSLEIFYTILISWNVITFALMAIDKGKAENEEYRISEKALFMSAFFLGALGIYLGMQIFRHKTKHLSFKVFIPIAIIFNIIEIYFLFKTSLFS